MKRLQSVLVASTLAASVFFGQQSAQACGGLFCSAANPVEQTAERIVFATNDDDTVTAIIEVQYQGPSEKFAWLLPMPGIPKVEVSTVEVLNAIDAATQPQYWLNYDYQGDCVFAETATLNGSCPTCSGADDDAGGGGIEILDSGTAGPYDFVTLSADPKLDDAAQAALDWLGDNDYDVGGTGPSVLRPYLEAGLNLVAFRLTKGNDAGAIRPVKLTYEGSRPSIPIRPTAVAASDDMGIRVFLLGQARSVSENYLSVTLNESRINWFDWQDSYDTVVSEAADEAGGNGFVTEYAGSTERFDGELWTDVHAQSWAAISDSNSSGAEAMWEARGAFRSFEGFRRAVEDSVTLPEGVSMDEFAADPREIESQSEVEVVNKQAFLDAMMLEVVEPLKGAQALVDGHPYLTRLYTTLSPMEMVMDPVFVENAELEDVSNEHQADIVYTCEADGDSHWVITLKDGAELTGEGQYSWPTEFDALPAAQTIASVGASGAPDVMVNRGDDIDVMLAEFREGDTNSSNQDEPSNSSRSQDPNNDDTSASSGDDGCSVGSAGRSSGSETASFFALLGAALAFSRRRRG